jgi:hypothetical protein
MALASTSGALDPYVMSATNTLVAAAQKDMTVGGAGAIIGMNIGLSLSQAAVGKAADLLDKSSGTSLNTFVSGN